jgi:hypothetical protein
MLSLIFSTHEMSLRDMKAKARMFARVDVSTGHECKSKIVCKDRMSVRDLNPKARFFARVGCPTGHEGKSKNVCKGTMSYGT